MKNKNELSEFLRKKLGLQNKKYIYDMLIEFENTKEVKEE